MKRLIAVFVALGLLAFAASAAAQEAKPGNKIGWEQSAPTLADAQNYTYKYYPDAANAGIPLTAVTCTGTASPFACEVAFPAFTPGSHTLTLTASNAAGESPKSSPPLSFTFVVIPSAPANVVIK